jgi:TonB family protein
MDHGNLPGKPKPTEGGATPWYCQQFFRLAGTGVDLAHASHLTQQPSFGGTLEKPRGVKMQFSRLVISLAIAIFFDFGLPAAQSQNEAPATTQEDSTTQTARLKAIDQPMAPYPLEAVRRGIEGKVELSIVVDANGKVTQAKALSGPEELFPAALASVKMWHYEIPASAPITMTVEIGYGVPKECPCPISDMGEVEGNGRLFDKNGKLVAVVDDSDSQSALSGRRTNGGCRGEDGSIGYSQ